VQQYVNVHAMPHPIWLGSVMTTTPPWKLETRLDAIEYGVLGTRDTIHPLHRDSLCPSATWNFSASQTSCGVVDQRPGGGSTWKSTASHLCLCHAASSLWRADCGFEASPAQPPLFDMKLIVASLPISPGQVSFVPFCQRQCCLNQTRQGRQVPNDVTEKQVQPPTSYVPEEPVNCSRQQLPPSWT